MDIRKLGKSIWKNKYAKAYLLSYGLTLILELFTGSLRDESLGMILSAVGIVAVVFGWKLRTDKNGHTRKPPLYVVEYLQYRAE